MRNFKITLKSPTTVTTTKAGSSSQLSIILALITLAQFMTVVDFTIVQVALPSIGREFGVSVNGLQWIVTAYGLTLAGFLLLCGRVGDMYGRKKLFIIGVLVFSLASMAGGIAPSEIVLILARVVQGLGAAMASATGLSILAAAFPEGKERNRVLGVFAARKVKGDGETWIPLSVFAAPPPVIKRKVHSNDKPVRVEYWPTEKCLALQPILDTMAAYSLRYCSRVFLKMQSQENLKKYMEERYAIYLRAW